MKNLLDVLKEKEILVDNEILKNVISQYTVKDTDTTEDIIEILESDDTREYITELSHCFVDVYNSDLFDWLKENYEVFERCVEGGLIRFKDVNFSLPDAIMIAQHMEYERDTNEELFDIIKTLEIEI